MHEHILTEEWKEKITAEFEKHFQNSGLFIKKAPMGDKNSFTITILLGKDKTECNNKITHNDPLRSILWVRKLEKEKFELTKSSLGLDVKTENKYMHSEIYKIPFRKSTGSMDKIVSNLGKTFEKMANAVRLNINNMRQLPFNPIDKLKNK